jgi:hypothetical protein
MSDEVILTPAQRIYLQDLNSALHESGHLAAAIHRGVPSIAKIGWDGFSSGRMNYDPTGVSVENSLFITFGGIVVVEKFQLRRAGLALDLADIEKALVSVSVAEAEILRAKVRRDAETFVDAHLGCIFRLALALIEKRSLDEHTATKVFTGEIEIQAPDEFCDALNLLPRAVWLE